MCPYGPTPEDWNMLTKRVTLPPFDMNAPFDAPLRYRERLEQLERERSEKAMRDPTVRRKLREIVREAYAKIEAGKK